jgi:hypothetical protein
VLRHEVGSETHALVRQAKKALEDEVGGHLDDDAFMGLLARRALQPANGPVHRIAITKCDDCKRAWQDGAGARVELPAETLDRIACDAEHMDARGDISRHIPAATRRLVLQRDRQTCRVPWCRSTRHLEPHHIEHFGHGGDHDPDNLITLCWHHHEAIHKGKLVLRGENGAWTFERTDSPPANDAGPSTVDTAIQALVRLGFHKREAQSFVETAIAHVGKAAPLAELIREALRRSPAPKV